MDLAKKHKKKWLFWGLAVFFYFYEFFLRVAPTVMVSELMRDFKIQSLAIGSLSSSYLYAYAFMQIPVGLLMDRFGARKLLTLASVGCGLGSVLFGIASQLWVAELGRVFMGAGSAFAFIGMVYICSHWFERRRIATLVAIGNSLGMLGAVGGEGPLAILVNRMGWRSTSIVLGALGILLAIVNYFAIRDDNSQANKQDEKRREKVETYQNFKTVISSLYSWLNGIGSFLYYTTTTTFASLWGIPFLQTSYGFTKVKASFVMSLVFIGWIIGGPLVGKLSDYLKNRKWIIVALGICATIAVSVVVYTPSLSTLTLSLLLLLIGIFSSAQNLTYCLAIELNPESAKGIASSFTNFIIFLGGSTTPLLVGLLLNKHWSGKMIGGIPSYTTENFRAAFVVFPIAFVLSVCIYIFMKKSPINANPLESPE